MRFCDKPNTAHTNMLEWSLQSLHHLAATWSHVEFSGRSTHDAPLHEMSVGAITLAHAPAVHAGSTCSV
jgi:hypothetical protein